MQKIKSLCAQISFLLLWYEISFVEPKLKQIMKSLKFSLAFLMLISLANLVKAQDAMILKYKKDTLWVKVFEIGTDEIKYKFWPVDQSMPLMAEEKGNIKWLRLENGTVMRFADDDFSDPKFYANQKKMAVKLEPFSLIAGTLSLGFEKSIEPGRSWEAGLGIIGLGNNSRAETGLFLRGGYKFINTPDYMLKGMRYAHILKGAYVKPELVVSTYLTSEKSTIRIGQSGSFPNYTYTYETTNTERRSTGVGAILNFGKQWVFSDIFLVDVFVGLGLGYGSIAEINKTTSTYTSSNGYDYNNYYEYNGLTAVGLLVNDDNRIGLAGQAGLKIGVLIGSEGKDK
jgi:hypothetical protein